MRLITLAGVLGMTYALCGCNSSEADAVKTAPLSSDMIVQRIQNDPHMPPDQKAAAIAKLQSHPAPDKPADTKPKH